MLSDKYPDQAGFAAGSDTSENAAEKLTMRKELHSFILVTMKTAYPDGFTVDELKVRAEVFFRRTFDRSTIAARCTELSDPKVAKIIATPETRLSPRKRPAHVYVMNNGQVIPKSADEPNKAEPDAAHKMAQLLWDCLKLNTDGTGTIKLGPLDLSIAESYAVEAGLKRG